MDENTVIVAYDGSGAAREAVAAAATLFGPCRMLVVTVWEPSLAYAAPVIPEDAMSMTPVVNPEVTREIEGALHGRADDLAREGVELATSLGRPAEPLAIADAGDVANTLLDLAHERGAAAIVVGSRGHSGLRARLEGSTSKSLLKHAPCPLLVVHETHAH